MTEIDLDFAPVGRRRSIVCTESDVLDAIKPGTTIGIGGFINTGHPMSLIRGIIRRGIKDLVVVGAASSGLEVDMLIASGAVRKVITPYVGAEGLASIGPAFRAAAQAGELNIWEVDEAHFYAGLRAAAQRLPFNPWRAGVGTSYPEINPELKLFRDPINDELLIAVPAIEIDVALLHASVSDAYGNVQHTGTGYGDRAINAAADMTYVTVEKIVPNQHIKANPMATSIADADGVLPVPFGSHPFGSQGFYAPDRAHLTDYVKAATDWLRTGSRSQLDEYFERFVFGPQTHAAYLTEVGFDSLLSLHEYHDPLEEQ